MIVAPLPTWKELLGVTKQQNTDDILTSGSAISIKLIIEGYRKSTQKTSINIMLPDYFCAETEALFFDDDLKALRYPLDDRMEPDWKTIKKSNEYSHVDIFIFVHYFGHEHDISRARAFCDVNQSVLIEDCAHVLYGYGKMDKKSHFSIYSPHKYLPIPDGGIIKVNSDDELTNNIRTHIEEKVSVPNTNKHIKWRCKKVALKLFRISKNNSYELGPHYIDLNKVSYESYSISNYSKKLLSAYSYEDLKEIAHKRRINLQIINAVLKSVDSNIRIMTDDYIECPLFAAYSLENIDKPLDYVEELRKLGLNISFWPSTHKGIVPLTDEYEKLTKYIITIPVHQSLNINKLAKILDFDCKTNIADFSYELLSDTAENRKRWNAVLDSSPISNITQDWTYGDVKSRIDGWDIKRYLFKDKGHDIGVVQLLIKKIGPITMAYRINKGPIFITEYSRIDNELFVINCIKNQNARRPFFFVPYAAYSVDNLAKVVKAGWKLWNPFGFPTGEVDLTQTEEQIRAGLESKWRNQLKTAEKNNYVIKSDYDRFDEMIELYTEEQEEKNFEGVPIPMLMEMRKEPSPLKILYVLDNSDRIIAFDMFYVHSNVATYYIGWNSSEEGRKNYLNNLLLFYAAIELKKMGIKKLDLGGIEYIHTESIARFKDGMKPKHFRQIGEFIKV